MIKISFYIQLKSISFHSFLCYLFQYLFLGYGNGRSYTKEDMEAALDALRDRSLSLTRASEKFGIPPTTLWQVIMIISLY